MLNRLHQPALRSRCLLLALATGLAACAKPSTPEIVAPGEVKVRIGQIDPVALESAEKSAPPAVAARTEQLVDALWEAGCLGSDVETPLPRVASENPDVVCSLRGRTPHRIFVLAHLDGDARGKGGPPEHWSGVALLPFLYKALSVEPREHTFVFAAFGKSPARTTRDYLERLGATPEESVRAIIDLQDVDPRAIWFSSSDAGLRRDFVAASLAVGRPLESLRSFLPTADEGHGVATLTIAAEPPGGMRGRKKGAALEAPPQTEATSLPATARFTAVFLAYADETLRLRAEPPASVPASPDEGAR